MNKVLSLYKITSLSNLKIKNLVEINRHHTY